MRCARPSNSNARPREVQRTMPTLRFRRFEEIAPDDQEHVAFLRARMRGEQEITGIFGAQAHWPGPQGSRSQASAGELPVPGRAAAAGHRHPQYVLCDVLQPLGKAGCRPGRRWHGRARRRSHALPVVQHDRPRHDARPAFTDLRASDFQPGGRLASAQGPGAPPQSI